MIFSQFQNIARPWSDRAAMERGRKIQEVTHKIRLATDDNKKKIKKTGGTKVVWDRSPEVTLEKVRKRRQSHRRLKCSDKNWR